jgi:predicted small lipoprotein YifL
MLKVVIALCCLIALLGTSGCGLKGPLYQPPAKPAKSEPDQQNSQDHADSTAPAG